MYARLSSSPDGVIASVRGFESICNFMGLQAPISNQRISRPSEGRHQHNNGRE